MKASRSHDIAHGSVYKQAPCAGGYDDDRFGGRFGQDLERREVERYTELLGPVAGPVLDAGSGTGKLAVHLLEAGCDVTASDFSVEMLKIGRGKARDAGVNGRFVVADVRSLCFPSAAFAQTCCSRVLMHVGDWHAAIAELCRVTGEALVLDFPPTFSAAGLDSLLKRLLRRSADHTHQTYRTFVPREVVKALHREGFRVVETRRAFLLPILLHRRVDRPALSAKIENLLAYLGLTRLFGAPVTLKAVRSSNQDVPVTQSSAPLAAHDSRQPPR